MLCVLGFGSGVWLQENPTMKQKQVKKITGLIFNRMHRIGKRHSFVTCRDKSMPMKAAKWSALLIVLIIVGASCKKETATDDQTMEAGPYLVFKFKFDSTQARLDNTGNPSTVPSGHSGISPAFNGMSTNYVELAPGAFTALGNGEIVYNGAVTSAGGDVAVDFDKATIAPENQIFLSVPISSITPGTYEYLRSSLTYQNYDVPVRESGMDLNMTVASFVGFNTYITDFVVKTKTHTVNDDKLQGYWVVEVDDSGFPGTIPLISGQAPEGATTVPNPLFASSPIPPGSCVVTGAFPTPLTITGNETDDIVITMSVSTNKSFEFTDPAGDGIYEPSAGDTVVDMGVRGLIPYVNL